MRPRKEVDAELHLLRSIAQAQPGQVRQQIESARFNLYTAFEAGDEDLARRWSHALRGACALIPADVTGNSVLAFDAIRRIESAIDAS